MPFKKPFTQCLWAVPSCPKIQTNSRPARLDPVVSENAKGAGSGYQQMSD